MNIKGRELDGLKETGYLLLASQAGKAFGYITKIVECERVNLPKKSPTIRKL